MVAAKLYNICRLAHTSYVKDVAFIYYSTTVLLLFFFFFFFLLLPTRADFKFSQENFRFGSHKSDFDNISIFLISRNSKTKNKTAEFSILIFLLKYRHNKGFWLKNQSAGSPHYIQSGIFSKMAPAISYKLSMLIAQYIDL